MSPTTDAIFTAALSLPADERAVLAEKLLESLEEKDRAEIDKAWVEEAESRLRAFEQKTIQAFPGQEVLQSLMTGKKQ